MGYLPFNGVNKLKAFSRKLDEDAKQTPDPITVKTVPAAEGKTWCVLLFDRNLDTGLTRHKRVAFGIPSLSEAEAITKSLRSRYIKIDDQLVYTKWYEVREEKYD